MFNLRLARQRDSGQTPGTASARASPAAPGTGGGGVRGAHGPPRTSPPDNTVSAPHQLQPAAPGLGSGHSCGHSLAHEHAGAWCGMCTEQGTGTREQLEGQTAPRALGEVSPAAVGQDPPVLPMHAGRRLRHPCHKKLSPRHLPAPVARPHPQELCSPSQDKDKDKVRG